MWSVFRMLPLIIETMNEIINIMANSFSYHEFYIDVILIMDWATNQQWRRSHFPSLFCLGNLHGGLIAAFKYLQGAYLKDLARTFMVVSSRSMMTSWNKKFWLRISESIFPTRAVQEGRRIPRFPSIILPHEFLWPKWKKSWATMPDLIIDPALGWRLS